MILRSRRSRASRRTTATAIRDGGFTLPELLVAMSLTGILVAVMATAITVMLRVTPKAEVRLAESKDITFLQTWVPVDLSSAINSYDDPDDAVVKAALVANDPFLSYNADLPGTNVLTLVIPDLETGEHKIISYRYIEIGGAWQLSRFRITNPGAADEQVSPVGVAHEVPAPPAGWTPDQKPIHAFEITSRNQVVLRPIGENITVRFESGNEFSTGGSGLSAETDLTPNDPITLPDPTAPPSRCGGRVALVLDTSWSVPNYDGGGHLEAAATSFIDSFQGTPTQLTIMGFDAIAYQMYPNLNGVRGQYIDLLNPSADIDDAKSTIESLPNVDASTKPGNQGSSYYYGNGNADVGWSQKRTDEDGSTTDIHGGQYWGNTNWEDALHAPFFDKAGVQRATVPETVIFITDGEPNSNRYERWGGTQPASDVAAAATAANAGRSTGARVVGILVGPVGGSAEANLATVVGANKWTGTPGDLQNAVAADYFTGSFDELGGVLRSIMAAQCGGTVTVQKEVNGQVAEGLWTYSSEIGDNTLDLTAASSITFDYVFDTGVTERDIVIHEEVKDGFIFAEAQCTIAGDPIPLDRIIQNPDGAPGVALKIRPDEAVSCTMVSNPE